MNNVSCIMPFRVLCIVVLVLSQASFLWAQKRIDYYAHTKTYYKDGTVKVESGNSGQFITRNGNVCYDSNRDGYGVGNGSLTLKLQKGNTYKFVGTCYYKGECSYTFYDDRGVLNIEDILGNIYVYKRITPSDNVRTSSLIKKQEQLINQQDFVSSPTTTVIYDNGNNSSSTWSNQKQDTHQAKYMTCPHCNGTKRLLLNRAGYISKNQYWVTCSECGQKHLNTTIHRHVDCYYCNGTGKIRIN